jgi:tRNA pseudouridine synthase 10
MRASNIEEVRRIKEARSDKTYKALVICEGVSKVELAKLKKLIGNIKQKTPERVLHRRADKFRDRRLKSLQVKSVNKRKFYLIVKCEAGLYVKELISGDNGRTNPSVSSILGKPCICEELDVLKIHR